MRKITEQITIIGLIAFIILVSLILFLQIINNQKIAWGVKIAKANMGGHHLQVSQKNLKKKWADFADQGITLVYQTPENNLSAREPEQNWTVKLTDLGFQIDEQSTIKQAYQIGRRSNALVNLKEQLAALIGHYNLEPTYLIDQERFQNKTVELFKEIERPAQNATLVFDEKMDDFLLVHSTNGITIERKQLLANLSGQIKSFSNQPINLQLVIDYPSVTNNEVERARQKTQEILANLPFQLNFGTRVWNISKKIIIDWLKFEPILEDNSNNLILGLSLDQDKTEKYLAQIALIIDQPSTNARLETLSNRATVFSPDQPGFEVKMSPTLAQLEENILADQPVKKTSIMADKALPKITLAQTNDLGINSLLGQGISNFAGSPKNRIHNIKTGVAKFNGLILNPGEEFSFNTFLGDSGPEAGFLPELVIKKNKTVPEYGGGLCQVSTTVFRAAVKSGLKITERTAHAFPVEYYSPQGFDATIYDPRPDLRFINDSSAHLLIQTVIKGTQLTFNFYGTDDGRQIKIIGPYVLEKKEDGSMKTILTQEIYQKGELIDKQVFYSNYKSPDLYPVESNNSQNNNSE